jgi:hypothetical protein
MKEVKTPTTVRNKFFDNAGFHKPEYKRHWSFTGPKRGYKRAGSLQPSAEQWAMMDRS